MTAAAKIRYRIKRRDGLPKACSVDEWLALHRSGDKSPRLGGIVVLGGELAVVARVGGRVIALPFAQYTEHSALRDLLSASDSALYGQWWAEAMAGNFAAAIEKARRNNDGMGF
jgi:hypothetical protein